MSVLTKADIASLSVAERIQLVEDIWDSIAETPEDAPVTEDQRRELDARLSAMRQDPAGGSSWEAARERIRGRR